MSSNTTSPLRIDPNIVADYCPHESEVRRRDPAIVDVTKAIQELSFENVKGKVLVIYTGGMHIE